MADQQLAVGTVAGLEQRVDRWNVLPLDPAFQPVAEPRLVLDVAAAQGTEHLALDVGVGHKPHLVARQAGEEGVFAKLVEDLWKAAWYLKREIEGRAHE